MPRFTKRTGTGRSKYQVDVKAVTDYFHALETRYDHVTRKNLHRLDESIWQLEKYVLEELKTAGMATDASLWPAFTSNAPRTYWNAIRRAVTANQPRIKVHLPGLSTDDGDVEAYNLMLQETDRHEHFAYGLWAEIDEKRVKRGRAPFQNTYAWLMAIRGGCFLRPWFLPDGRTPFDVDIWDPLNTVYEPGDEGLDAVCHHYRTPYYDVADRYASVFGQKNMGYDDVKDKLGADGEGNVEVWDAWWCEYDQQGDPHVWNVVVGGSEFVLSEPYEWRDLDHLPIYLTRSFGPDMESEANLRNIARQVEGQWESIYTANRGIYPWINRILTLYGLYLRNNAIGPWHAKGTGLNTEQLASALKPFGIIASARADATITPVTQPQMANEAKEFLNNIESLAQNGSVPNAVFGQLSYTLSGFAINQLQGAIGITAEPLAKMMGFGYRLCTDELIQQFRQRGRRVTVKGMDTRRRMFIEDIKKAQLRDKYNLEVTVKAELPIDKLQMAQAAQMWQQAGVDPLTILDEVLDVDSPREILQRIVIWGQLQQEMQQRAQMAPTIPGQEPGPSNPLPQVASPPTMGIPNGPFSPSAQHLPASPISGQARAEKAFASEGRNGIG